MPELPPYLRNTDPMEPEDLPLQVALLTMELASVRERLHRLDVMIGAAGRVAVRLADAMRQVSADLADA
jgi:hypothetical protein